MSQENVAVVRSYFKAWNAGAWMLSVRCMTPMSSFGPSCHRHCRPRCRQAAVALSEQDAHAD